MRGALHHAPHGWEMRTATLLGELGEGTIRFYRHAPGASIIMSKISFHRLFAVTLIGLPGLAVSHLAAAATVTRSDGAELIYATTSSVSAQNPALSPDGTTLIFTLYTNGYDGGPNTPKGGVYRMPAAGGTATEITSSQVASVLGATNVNGLATWNVFANLVTFADTAADADIWTIAPDGSALRRITDAANGPGAPDNPPAYQEPTFSPDGKTIVFEEDVSNGSSSDGYVGSIDIVPTGGGAVRRLLVGGDASDNRLPVWSPDGTKILFQRRTTLSANGIYRLFTINPDGTGLTQITGVGSKYDNLDSDASWSPDGKWILDSACYGSGPLTPCPDGAESNIFLVSADGTKVVRVTTSASEDGAPAMSPDGRWIYFESHTLAGKDNSTTQIWRIATPAH